MANRAKYVAIIAFALLGFCAIGGAAAFLVFHAMADAAPNVRISSLGFHPTATSSWIESVDARREGDALVLTIQERPLHEQDGRGWSIPTGRHGVQRGLVRQVPFGDRWEITICDEARTVTYSTGSYELVYDHSSLGRSVTHEQVLHDAERAGK